jgi:MoaA/NifB/PqqE/SkfB family radical SAM enzyme/ubiquinone/menaquinone biosynthesis C-methylase UbiE
MRNGEFIDKVAEEAGVGVFTPRLYDFFVEHLGVSPPRKVNGKYVVNNFIPPFPSPAFTRFLDTFFSLNGSRGTVHGADVAVTNACPFNCYHCYNAGRRIADLPAATWVRVIRELCGLGAGTICVTGGEPCLRTDLADICAAIPDDCAGVLSTTGYNFTDSLAEGLRDTAVYSVSFSLDSPDEEEHDKLRGRPGAYRIALTGIERALQHGFYTYVCTVPTRKLLRDDGLQRLVALADEMGIPELQVIEPAPAGRLLEGDGGFGPDDFEQIRSCMAEVNRRGTGVIMTSVSHIESPEAFGCGAGTSHIYIDGTGEVSPCNMLPVTYGCVAQEPLPAIVARMQQTFGEPCADCLAFTLHDSIREHASTARPVPAVRIPGLDLEPGRRQLPRFYQILEERPEERAGAQELREGYDEACESYDEYWLDIAGAPIDEMFGALPDIPGGTGVDCGCGTGYATLRLTEKLRPDGIVLAVDLSPGMIGKARRRLAEAGALHRARFTRGDVLGQMAHLPGASLDAATMTWLIGYVSCADAFPAIRRVLKPGGFLGFVAHLDRSPLVPIEEFEALAKERPDAFAKYVEFEFPADAAEVYSELAQAAFEPVRLEEGTFDFVCATGRDVYDHLVKSGAGTTYWLALKQKERERFRDDFIARVDARFAGREKIVIEHRYVLGVARAV